jgi:hypothetical protein
MSQVILFPRGQLTQTDQDRMQEVGIIAVEVDDPSKVTAAPVSASLIPGDDLLYAAIVALNEHNYGKAKFCEMVMSLMKSKRT